MAPCVRGAQLTDAGCIHEGALDVADRADELWVACLQRPALDEHALRVAAVEPGGGIELRRAAGIAGLGIGVAERLRPDRPAQDERSGHESEPPEHRELAVAGAPAAHARGEVPWTVRGRVAGGSHASSLRLLLAPPRGSAAGSVCAICTERSPVRPRREIPIAGVIYRACF